MSYSPDALKLSVSLSTWTVEVGPCGFHIACCRRVVNPWCAGGACGWLTLDLRMAYFWKLRTGRGCPGWSALGRGPLFQREIGFAAGLKHRLPRRIPQTDRSVPVSGGRGDRGADCHGN